MGEDLTVEELNRRLAVIQDRLGGLTPGAWEGPADSTVINEAMQGPGATTSSYAG